MPVATEAREQRAIVRALRILDTRLKTPGLAVSNPRAARDFLALRMAELEREEFHVLWLDSGNRVIATEVLFIGTLNQTNVYPREVARAALYANAAAVIVAHNHPSGRPEPSVADIEVTRTLRAALDLIGVRLLDHIIVAGTSAVSLAEAGHVI